MRRGTSWANELLAQLEASGKAGTDAVGYVHEHNIRLGVVRQPTGARWTLGRKISLHPRYAQGSPAAPYALSLVIHEIQHIKQGPAMALSVYGELDAWQVQFNFLLDITGGYRGVPGQVDAIKDLLALPLSWDRPTLRAARRLMSQYAGRYYRIGLLPLYPLHQELLYGITGRRPA